MFLLLQLPGNLHGQVSRMDVHQEIPSLCEVLTCSVGSFDPKVQCRSDCEVLSHEFGFVYCQWLKSIKGRFVAFARFQHSEPFEVYHFC